MEQEFCKHMFRRVALKIYTIKMFSVKLLFKTGQRQIPNNIFFFFTSRHRELKSKEKKWIKFLWFSFGYSGFKRFILSLVQGKGNNSMNTNALWRKIQCPFSIFTPQNMWLKIVLGAQISAVKEIYWSCINLNQTAVDSHLWTAAAGLWAPREGGWGRGEYRTQRGSVSQSTPENWKMLERRSGAWLGGLAQRRLNKTQEVLSSTS